MIGQILEGGAIGRALRSSIGKKVIVALTGLALVGFLVAHLAGNLLMFKGEGEAFDAYAHTLTSNPLIVPADFGLVAIFLVHVILAIALTRQNRTARAVPYRDTRGKGARTLASSTMIYSGLVVFAFLVMHLVNFKYGLKPVNAAGEHSLWLLVMQHFQSPFNTLIYAAAMLVVGLHVSHGVQSVFRTLGLVHPTYTPLIRGLSLGLGAIFALGFGSIPVWAILKGLPS